MFHYIFPLIDTIDDVLPAIKNSKEFIVVDRGPYNVINYVVVNDETFPDVKTSGGDAKGRAEKQRKKAIRRECRGLIFDAKTGVLLRRPYHKFFNMNERPETLENNINWHVDHQVLEKLDGSMVTPFVLRDKIYWATRMGITDVALEAEKWVLHHANYMRFAEYCASNKITPIFEWCSNASKIVIDHPEDRLILTGARTIRSGTYVSSRMLREWADRFLLDLVQDFDWTRENIVTDLREKENFEGVVVRFSDGHMIKVKTEWYALRHKSRDAITSEKNVLNIIFNDQLDDIKPYLVDADRERIQKFADNVLKGVADVAKSFEKGFKIYQNTVNFNRKEFALEREKNGKYPMTQAQRSIYFSMWDGNDAMVSLWEYIKRNLGTREKIANIRDFIGGHFWKP